MTTVISRVYAAEATADSVLAALRAAGHPEADTGKFKGGGKNQCGPGRQAVCINLCQDAK